MPVMNHECIHNQCHSSTGHPEVTFMSRNTNDRKEELTIIIIIKEKKERSERNTRQRVQQQQDQGHQNTLFVLRSGTKCSIKLMHNEIHRWMHGIYKQRNID